MVNDYVVAEQAFVANLRRVLDDGNEITARGMKTKEIESQTISIIMPEKRCYFIPWRHDNIFAKIAETLWQLRGRDDIAWLSYYLPRVFDYSDNGKTWRGAYGPRLRNWNGSDKKCDQLAYVIRTLLDDPYSRQAVISIWDPSEDTIPVSKDRPCNNWLQFYGRQNYANLSDDMYLNMNVAQRSCDLLWGYSGIDTFSWSVLQQMMAYWTNMKVGHFNHFITSLHLYEKHWGRGEVILNAVDNTIMADGGTVYCKFPLDIAEFSTNFSDFDTKLEYLFDIERNMRMTPDQYELDLCTKLGDDFLCLCGQMMFVYILYTEQKKLGVINWYDVGYCIEQMPSENDFRLAAIEYFTRDNIDLLQYITLSITEKDVLTNVYKRI